MWVYFWIFSSMLLINLTVFIPIIFYYYCSVVELEVRDGATSRSSYIVQYYLSCPIFLYSHMNLRILLSRFVKNCVGILTWIELNLYIACGKMAIFYYVNPTNP